MNRAILRLPLLGALLTSVSLLCACATTSERSLVAADSGSTIKMSTGDTLKIELESNPTTGYRWDSIAPYDQDLLVLVGDDFVPPEGNSKKLCGAPGKQVFVFKAFAPGRTGVKLGYKRPWERDEKPDKTFAILVQISGKPLEAPEDSDTTPRVGSDGKVAKDPAEELYGK